MIFDKDHLANFSKVLTEKKNENDEFDDSPEARAKYQIEYYFGKLNYPKDEYLKSYEDKDGWIPLG